MKNAFTIPALTSAAALAGLLLVPTAHAQAGAAAKPAGDAPATKVAVINIQTAITSSSEGKQASAELQSQFAPRSTELDNMRKQIEDIQTRLRTGATTLSDDEKARLTREGDTLTRAFQRKGQDIQDDENEAQREVVDRIGRKMLDVIDKYAKDNGFAAVLDISAQNTPVVYAAPETDITQDIVRLYDQAHPVKAAAASAKPAAPKPAAQKPAATPPQH